MTPEDALHAARELGFPATDARVLSGGALNHVFRVTGEGTAILKHAPPHVAAVPEVPLDPSRSGFERTALQALHDELADVPGDIRVPRVLGAAGSTLLLEDLGDLPDLSSAPHRAVELGPFLRRLHTRSAQQPDLAGRFRNDPVQHTRHAVQYLALGAWVPALADRGRQLGETFLEPGRCLIMGDLWLPSVLVGPSLAVIDWELCHWGRPAQDLGHLVAHLWMRAHVDGTPSVHEAFLEAYGPVDPEEHGLLYAHAGAEILARVHGPFRGSGPYATTSAAVLEEADQQGRRWVRAWR
ncbi:MAG: phosphotransferase [Alphaproteobacteria bacterium]|nr:phosphotransferase [Alphaproteobacteria bacterium]